MVLGNFIGTDSNGDNLGNSIGVLLSNSPSNTIGGGNTIGFNAIAGIEITGASSTGDLVLGNLIGTNGTASLPNGVGVLIDTGAHSNTLDSNTIGGNTSAGVSITGASTTGNVVVGNLVGLQGSAGPLGNSIGVLLSNSPSNTIGGGNTIGFNAIAGIEITGASSTGDLVLGNLIGTNGTAGLANGVGVLIDTGAHSNTLDSNTIGGNTNAGIFINDAQNNLIGGATDGCEKRHLRKWHGDPYHREWRQPDPEQPDRHRCERQPCSGQRVRWHRRQ